MISCFKWLFIGIVVHSFGYACEQNMSHWVLKGGEAYHKKTKLTWMRCSLGRVWQKDRCVGDYTQATFGEIEQLIQQKYPKWRIPTIEEIATLVNETCIPFVDTKVFPDISPSEEDSSYWTRSVFLDNADTQEMPALLYTIDFTTATVDVHTKGLRYRALLVK